MSRTKLQLIASALFPSLGPSHITKIGPCQAKLTCSKSFAVSSGRLNANTIKPVEGSFDMLNNLVDKESYSMRVLHVTYSTSGGAGRVCGQLSESLENLGVNSKIFSISDSNISKEPFNNPLQTATALADKFFVGKSLSVGHFSHFRGALSNPKLISEIKNADIVHLHWPAGVLSKQAIGNALDLAPIVWTLHDYWALTGGCHFPGGCQNFVNDCENCPVSRPPFQRQVNRQRILSRGLSRVQFVAPTESAMKTALDIAPWIQNIKVIPNPVKDDSSFPDERKRGKTGITVGLIATNIQDPRKRILEFLEDYAVVTSNLRLGSPPRLLIGGAGRLSVQSDLVSHFGVITEKNIDEFYGQIDALAVPSLDETFSLVTVESLLKRRPVFAIGSTAQAGLIQEFDGGKTFDDLRSLAEGVASYQGGFMVTDDSVNRLVNETRPDNVARRYLEIYKQALDEFNKLHADPLRG